jgi:uncharacterized protein YecA (UPF0149 family)
MDSELKQPAEQTPEQEPACETCKKLAAMLQETVDKLDQATYTIEWLKASRDGTTVGRNKPCPCGSGKKYKRCCLGKEVE